MEMSNQKIHTFLMFNGKAEEAMNFYVSAFSPAEVVSVVRYGAEGPGAEGSVLHASFSLKGQRFMCIDNSNKQNFAFTPAMSLFVTCDSEEEIDRVFAQLSDGGQVFMPLSPTPVSTKFGWVGDRFGVSWQLNLPRG